ncbi:hypothetical protein HMPREF0277_2191, partial [Corynebacterium accolens ATCC 49726]
TGESAAAANWGLPAAPQEALELARTAPVRPVPLIRNDSGQAVAGSATISDWSNGPLTGEIIIDDATLAASGRRTFGARLVPMTDAPGILAARATSPVEPEGRLRSLLRKPGRLDPDSVHTGRAVQAGGPQLRVLVDASPTNAPSPASPSTATCATSKSCAPSLLRSSRRFSQLTPSPLTRPSVDSARATRQAPRSADMRARSC